MTDDNEFIDEIIEAQERTAKNIELLADEIGVSESKLESGASPQEQKIERQKAALVAGADVEKTDTGGSSAETAADLMKQNQSNIAAVAKAAGVSSHKLADGSGSTDRDLMALFGGGGTKTKSTDGDPTGSDAEEALKGMDPDEQVAALFGYPGSRSQTPGDAWQREIAGEGSES